MDQEQVQKKLAELWKLHLPEIMDRVYVLEHACTALEAGELSEDERRAATAAAHKLAGVLGTFGRKRGTEAAREIETMLDTGAAQPPPMRSLVSELHQIVEG